MMSARCSFCKKRLKKETSYTVDKRLLIHYRISNARLSRKMSPFIPNVYIGIVKIKNKFIYSYIYKDRQSVFVNVYLYS
jgi:hypothetical protein